MGDIAIRVEHLGKQYRLGMRQASYTTFRETLINSSKAPLRWLKGEHKAEYNRFWALDDVSFEVEHGDAVGIIGRNGAGKSTLLKILSRITSPTRGRVDIFGRVGSLLEVGTGFHPELSGRENIYLNGAILGMSRVEIGRKFDEIVEFSGIEKFLDTPVKHYSSGMYVRLAFAVAAHLEPEILIVDEVLAVGDAEFQKKCMGKMGDVVHGGRTVLFVSHNMAAIKNLCNHCIWISNGKIKLEGKSDNVIQTYLGTLSFSTSFRTWDECTTAPGSEGVRLKLVSIEPHAFDGLHSITTNTSVLCKFQFWNSLPSALLNFSVVVKTADDIIVFNTVSHPQPLPYGIIEGSFVIPTKLLNDGVYKIRVLIVKDTSQILLDIDDVVSFEVHDDTEHYNWFGKWVGVIHPEFEWVIKHIT